MSGESAAGAALASSLAQIKQLLTSVHDENPSQSYIQVVFKTIIANCRKLTSSPNALLPPCMGELADLLLTVLSSNLITSLEGRSLCGVAFALVLCSIAEPSSVGLMYSKSFLAKGHDDEVRLRLYKRGSEVCVNVKREHVKLCLVYGLLTVQSPSFWLPTQVGLLTDRIFPLLETEAFSNSRQTLIAFKALVLWAKRFSSISRLTSSLAIRIINIVSSNWENPFNGVRDKNTLLLDELLLMTSDETNEDIPAQLRPAALLDLVLDETSWMVKSKYFLLSAVIRHSSPVQCEQKERDIVDGLISSLGHSHLVSAGTELYTTLLNLIDWEDWQKLFLNPILNLLTTETELASTINLFNYWIPPTLKKYRRCLDLIHIRLQMPETSYPYNLLLPTILTYKTARKEGYDLPWKTPQLRWALKCGHPLTRSNGFAVVCHSTKTTVFPSDDEFNMVETFLEENINSDLTPLRQSMFTSFTAFLARVKESCYQVMRIGKESPENDRNLSRAMTFLERLYALIMSSLEIGSNYQRRYAALEMFKIVLTKFATDSSRKSPSKDSHRVLKYAITVGKWSFTSESAREALLYCVSDAADDVRESASFLLITYFKISDSESSRFALLYNKGVGLCCDSMFYNADAGAVLIYTVTCLAYKGITPCSKVLELKTDRVSSALLSLAESQVAALKADLLYAATHGSPLYGCLEALGRLICDKKSPECSLSTQQEYGRLLELIESVVNHLLTVLSAKSDSISEYAPSFLEMGEAIETAVGDSEAAVEEGDKLHLSPSYQLLLSTIWLNLKSCCWLASRLPDFGSPICDAKRCLAIILSVLRQTRHKGALEAAGSALIYLISSISSSPRDSPLIDDTLNAALTKLENTGKDTSTTRGAGHIILIHRLLVGDTRPNRDSVTRCLRHLVDLVERDGHAQALHLLSVLLKDRSLSQDTAPFVHRLAAASFHSLAHSSWAVRNTALQLFGAIVPRLVGQRKSYENDRSCSCYHLPYEELYYHARPLVSAILDELKICESSHATLVPLLTLMSCLSLGILTIIDRKLAVFKKFVDHFLLLMSSPVSKVRQLAAEANAWFCSISQIPHMINLRVGQVVAFVNLKTADNDIKSENGLHGFLLNTMYLMVRYEDESRGVGALRDARISVESALKELRTVLLSPNVSYVCKAVVAQIVGYDPSIPPLHQMEGLSSISRLSARSLGWPIWQEATGREISEKCPPGDLCSCLKFAFDSGQSDIIRATLLGIAARTGSTELAPHVGGLLDVLLRTKYLDDAVLKLSLDLMIEYEVTPKSCAGVASRIVSFNNLSVSSSAVRTAVALGLLASDLENLDFSLLKELISRLRSMVEPSQDEPCRLVAAHSLALASPLILADSSSAELHTLRSELWMVGVTLLEDECATVRDEAAKFASKILVAFGLAGTPSPLNSYVCLRLLYKPQVLLSLFSSKEAVTCLWSRLRCSSTELSSLNAPPSQNPFDATFENMYAEPVKTIGFAYASLSEILAADNLARRIFVTDFIPSQLKELKSHGLRLRQFSEEAVGSGATLVDASWYITARRLSLQFQLIKNASDSDPDLIASLHTQYLI